MQQQTRTPLWAHVRLQFLLMSILWLLTGCASAEDWVIRVPPAADESAASAPLDLPAIAQIPPTNPIQNDIFYFVMPDRFANGSTENDLGELNGDRLITGFDPTDSGFYHGGDLAGLLTKLDYLDQMGITAIWMTPVFKNKMVQGAGSNVSASYHGYWITDYTQLNPHFGTNQELETLIEEAHARDIKIFFDIITNHTADVIQYAEGQSDYRNKEADPYLDASGVPFDDSEVAGAENFPALDASTSFPYTPLIPAGEESIKVPSWLNDPIYYHNRGNSTFSGESSLYGDFVGLDDLFTEHPVVVQGMIDIHKEWITNYDIDGFRIDTVKHVNAPFWRAFAQAILEHAKAQGKEEFFIFGEVFTGNEQFLSYYTTDSDLSAVLDFKFQEHVRSYVAGNGSAQALRLLFENDDFFTDEDSNVYSLPTFIGNHDRGRFGFFLNADQNGSLNDAELLARSKLAHAMMYFARGVPVIYYGDEQGFTGDGDDKNARQTMFPSQVASYNDDDLIGTDATHADDNFDPTHPLYQAFTDYAAIYQAHPALRTGAQIHRFAAEDAGIYAFSRIDRDEQVEYIVAINNGAAASAPISTFYTSGVTFNLIHAEGTNAETNSEETLTTEANGQVSINVPATGFVIYQASQPISPSSDAPEVTIANLVTNQEVALGFQVLDGNQIPQRMEIRASVASDQFAEVTFAVREQGIEEFALIGVDNSPPYRVFYDASAWPAGIQLEFLAVVNDLNNHYSSALVTGITPTYESVTEPGIPDITNRPYAIVHYLRNDHQYGDPTTSDFNIFWGLHLWGDGLASEEATEWDAPKPFWGEDSYGRFAWIELQDANQEVGFIVHQGEEKDGTAADRFFNPATDGPEIWLKQDDPNFYTSQAAAQGFVTLHYNRPDSDYEEWGLHIWGDAIAEEVVTEWTSARPRDGVDEFGAFWNVPIQDVAQPLNFIIHKGEEKDPGPDQSFVPQEHAAIWIKSGDEILYPQHCATSSEAVIHYRRAAGDYGDGSTSNAADFWGLHTWGAAADPGWATPYKPTATDLFGLIFRIPVDPSQELGYILHRGDEKDPGPDQFLNFEKWGCEVWQLQGADPEAPYIHWEQNIAP